MTAIGARERRGLLDTAHAALGARLAHGEPHRADDPAPGDESGGQGVFVTLRVRGQLRGCVGSLGDGRPLRRAVAELAVAAATGDWRFRPIDRDDLDDLTVEISVLSRAVPARPGDIVAGRHGVIVEMEGRRALLLPQVASEHGFAPEQLLDACCEKAGLPRRAWQDTGCRLQSFTAEVFGDERRAGGGEETAERARMGNGGQS